jgi:hypothetical protein
MQGTSDRINKLVARSNIGNMHIPAKKNVHLLRPVKDALGLKVPRIYYILAIVARYTWGRQAAPSR